jgi:hypothetical protein
MSCRKDQVEDLRVAVDQAINLASEQVFGGFSFKYDFKVFKGRFHDKGGVELWKLINEALVNLRRGREDG